MFDDQFKLNTAFQQEVMSSGVARHEVLEGDNNNLLHESHEFEEVDATTLFNDNEDREIVDEEVHDVYSTNSKSENECSTEQTNSEEDEYEEHSEGEEEDNVEDEDDDN